MHIITTNFFKGHEFERQQGVYMGRFQGGGVRKPTVKFVIVL